MLIKNWIQLYFTECPNAKEEVILAVLKQNCEGGGEKQSKGAKQKPNSRSGLGFATKTWGFANPDILQSNFNIVWFHFVLLSDKMYVYTIHPL